MLIQNYPDIRLEEKITIAREIDRLVLHLFYILGLPDKGMGLGFAHTVSSYKLKLRPGKTTR